MKHVYIVSYMYYDISIMDSVWSNKAQAMRHAVKLERASIKKCPLKGGRNCAD